MTRPFAAVERFFERLFERPAARLFHTSLQPIQIQRKLERAMDTGRVFSGDHAYVPTRYRVRLNPEDARGFDGYRQTLETELADALHARARARGYRLLARPSVAIESSGRIEIADINVIADVVDRKDFANGHSPDDGSAYGGPRGTGVFGVPVAPWSPTVPPPSPTLAPAPMASTAAPPAVAAAGPYPPAPAGSASAPAGSPSAAPPKVPANLGTHTETVPAPTPVALPPPALARVEVRTRGAFMGACDFRGGTASIGRARDNQIALPDDRVSRHHGQLSARQGNLVYTDLGSTNGSFVNGTRVREIVLGSGDVVRLGNSTLTIQPYA